MLWLARLLHPTVIAIRDGRCRLAKGQVPSRKLRDLDDVLAQFSVSHGSIAVDGRRRAHFSSNIPREAHQRLRNVLA